VEPEPIFTVGSIKPSGILTTTVGNENCSGLCGNAGHISVTAGSLTMGSGAQIDSGTNNTGHGGDILINATNTVSISGTLSDGTPAGIFSRTIGTEPGSGHGGNISLMAGQSVSLANGSSISASSTGPGNAGDILINAGQAFQAQNSSVTTSATQASGGNITINASGSVQLTNSQINTSVFGPEGTAGGNITIDPQVVILQNSQILAQANAGQGGNIAITTNLFLPDSTSIIDASSQSGINGTVTIQSPVSNLSANWARLQQSYLEAAALLRQRCAAKMSTGSSSLVMAGRDRIPLEPGSWLSSPVGSPASPAGTGVAFNTLQTSGHLSKSLHGRDGEFSIRRYGISPVFHSIMDAGCTP
jgi:large exoprotein involved in heme utilization and adhesion